MKKFIALILFISPSICVIGQGELRLEFSIYDEKNQPARNKKIWMEETTTKEKIEKTTNAVGRVEFIITSGKTWSFNTEEVSAHSSFRVPPSGTRRYKRTIRSRPKQEEVKTVDRSQLNIKRILHSLSEKEIPTAKECIIIVHLQTVQGQDPVKGIEVGVTSIENKTSLIAVTNNKGDARFRIPINKNYELDIDGIMGYHSFKTPNYQYYSKVFNMGFEPTNIKETVANDTIIQDLKGMDKGTSKRALFTLELKTYEEESLPDEIVCLDVLENNGKVYKAVTNKDGVARFLIPKEKQYQLHLKYERNLRTWDLRNRGSRIITGGAIVHYRGSKQIEEFFAEADRDEEGFLQEFQSSDAESIEEYMANLQTQQAQQQSSVFSPKLLNPKEWTKKTEHGYVISFPAQSSAATPAIVDKNLFVSGGFWSSEFYSFDAETGAYKWGLRLSECGATSATYEDGVILVSTESCTLYAIDAKTGKLMWSKWLSPYIYSTPSVRGNKVFACYPKKLKTPSQMSSSFEEPNEDFALVGFDLKTGRILWQKTVDAESLGSPVLTDDAVYLTTLAGTLYRFNIQNGSSEKVVRKQYFTSPPTVVDDMLYVSRREGETNKERVVMYDANTFVLKGETKLVGERKKVMHQDQEATMNYMGSRMIFYQGKNYNTMGNSLICSNPKNGSIIWSKLILPLEAAEKSVQLAAPVIIEGYVILGVSDGRIQVYDSKTGKLVSEYKVDGYIKLQPVVHEGVIYAGTHEGKVIRYETGNEKLTGWPMWNQNGAHNTVIR